MPLVHAAEAALKTISKGDIAVVKGMKTPSDGVKLVMEAVCIMLGVKPKRIPNPNGKGKINDYWDAAKSNLLNDIGFLKRLLQFDRDAIPASVIEEIEPYYQNASFVPHVIAKSSSACEGLCKWVRGMRDYDKVAKEVEPMQKALAAAQAKAKAAADDLAIKMTQLKKVQDELATLQAQLDAEMKKKKELEDQFADCNSRLARAQELLAGLGGEAERWKEAATRL